MLRGHIAAWNEAADVPCFGTGKAAFNSWLLQWLGLGAADSFPHQDLPHKMLNLSRHRQIYSHVIRFSISTGWRISRKV